jgi:hypothetical protein
MEVSINRIERTPGWKLWFGHGFVGDAEINFINFSKENYWGHHIAGGLHPRNYICGLTGGCPVRFGVSDVIGSSYVEATNCSTTGFMVFS